MKHLAAKKMQPKKKRIQSCLLIGSVEFITSVAALLHFDHFDSSLRSTGGARTFGVTVLLF